jgi:hypothetical protein
MPKPKTVVDPIAELERLDRFYDGEEEGARPIDVLRERGIEMPDESTLDDAAVYAALWKVIEGMAAVGVYVESTDHLSDRQLYRYLAEALTEGMPLSEDPAAGWHISPLGDSDEDNELYLRYYADDSTREQWHRDFGVTLPPKEPRPFDRDRLLPDQFEQLESEELQ